MSDASPLSAKRRLVLRDADDLVRIDLPDASAHGIPTATPKVDRVDLASWCVANRTRLREWRCRYGAILLRGFRVGGPEGLRALVLALGDRPMEYAERSSPRTRVGDGVYTSTEYAASQRILPHCENSYANQWPRHIAFHCRTPAETGGETPIVDCRRVLSALDPAIVAEFLARGVRYVRNYHPGLGLSWREVFGVDTREEAEARCRGAGYGFAWSDEGVLRTWRNAPAIVLHPETREPVWFNHAAFFHVASLPEDIARGLLARYAPESLPNHTFYGDGGAIDPAVIETIQRVYRDHAIVFPWCAEDVLLLDNMLYAHGRAPFTGPRSVLVSMSDPITAAEAIPG
ncbi:MAG: TauD/TfdA family dioxygenase [Pseudomonadota bacterium]